MEGISTAFLLVNKVKLRHSHGRPSRSDFVQASFKLTQMHAYDILIYKKSIDIYIMTHYTGLQKKREKVLDSIRYME